MEKMCSRQTGKEDGISRCLLKAEERGNAVYSHIQRRKQDKAKGI